MTHSQGGSISEQFIISLLKGLVVHLPLVRELSFGLENLSVSLLSLVHLLVLVEQVLLQRSKVAVKDSTEFLLFFNWQELWRKNGKRRLYETGLYVSLPSSDY